MHPDDWQVPLELMPYLQWFAAVCDDEPAPAIVDASPDALTVLPPALDDGFEDWGYAPEPDEPQHPRGLNDHGELCPECEGEGGDVMDEDNYWICDRCHGCGYYPPCGVHEPAPAYDAPRLTRYSPLVSLCWNCGGCGCEWCDNSDGPPVLANPQETWAELIDSPIAE